VVTTEEGEQGRGLRRVRLASGGEPCSPGTDTPDASVPCRDQNKPQRSRVPDRLPDANSTGISRRDAPPAQECRLRMSVRSWSTYSSLS
jgi:hypothetical protein